MFRIAALLAVLAVLAVPLSAAPIVDAANVGSYTTFQDQATGRVWLDLNNFFDASYLDMAATVQALGFTVATRSDVEQLLNTLALSGGEWSSYSAIMGSSPSRSLMWAAYRSTATVNWVYAFDSDTVWNYDEFTGTALEVVVNGGTSDADLNIWAYQGIVHAPEPASCALLGLGLLALAAFKVRR